jgi:hypothetical protein
MASVQKVINACQSPCPQVITPPESPTRHSPLRNVNLDDLKRLFVDAIKVVLYDQMSVEAAASGSSNTKPPVSPASPSGSSQSSLDIDRLNRLLMGAIGKPSSNATTGPPKLEGVVENNGSQPPVNAQPCTPPDSPRIDPSDYVSMGQLRQLFEAVLQQPQSSIEGPASVPATPDKGEKDNVRVRASKVEYKTVNEMYAYLPCEV